MFFAVSGTTIGALGGLFVNGLDGLILGASTGLSSGVLIWTILGVIERINAERRMERYFRHSNIDSK